MCGMDLMAWEEITKYRKEILLSEMVKGEKANIIKRLQRKV